MALPHMIHAQETPPAQPVSVPVTVVTESTPAPEVTPTSTSPQTTTTQTSQTTTSDTSNTRTLSIAEQERIINLTTNVLKKFTAALNRLDNIASRIEERMSTLRQEGANTPAQAESALVQAQNQINTARGSVESVRNISNIITSDTPRASFQTLRVELTATRDLIRAAHTNLIISVQTLRNPPQNIPPAPEVISSTSSASSTETITN